MRIPLAWCLLSCVLAVDLFYFCSLFLPFFRFRFGHRLFHPGFFLWVLLYNVSSVSVSAATRLHIILRYDIILNVPWYVLLFAYDTYLDSRFLWGLFFLGYKQRFFCFQVSFRPVKRGNRAGSSRNEFNYSRRGTQTSFSLLDCRSCENFELAHSSVSLLENIKLIKQSPFFDQLSVFWLHNWKMSY